MDSIDSFTQKKKKDLVAIATLFGILTEEKANRMSKPELIDFLQEQDRKSRASEEMKPLKVDFAAEYTLAASGASSSSSETATSANAEDPSEIEIREAWAKAVAEVAALPESAPETEPDMGSDKELDKELDKEPDTVPDAELGKEPKKKPKKEPEIEPEKKPKKEPKEAPVIAVDVQMSDALLLDALPPETVPDVEPVTAPDVEPETVENSEPMEEHFEVGSHDMPTQNAPSKKSSFDAGHRTGRSKRRSITITPKNEDYDHLSDDTFEDSYNGSDDSTQARSQKRGHKDASGDECDVSEAEDMVESEDGTESVHHTRTLRAKEQPQEMLSGVLEIMSEGYGFLRRENYLQGQNDIYVPAPYIRRFGLRLGDFIVGPCRPRREADRYQAIQYIKEVNGLPPEKMMRRVHFDRLTPIYPDECFVLETDRNELSTRIIDLVAPIGKGQRGMIVSPPKAGKTILLQKIANAISINNPDCKLIVLLIDERPEEVTDMQRSINGEVVYSTFDKTPENHVRIVELVLERAMRLVELGQDVVILLDSITRLSRAYNLTINPTGRTLSGGLDPGALYGPKRFFGAARNIEGGGSLTIIATSLIETGSRMDEVIFEEFKGTGNMEVYLDRKLSEKRIFPAIDLNKSGTRREELLLTPVALDAVWTIRKAFSQLDTSAVTEMIISLLMKTGTNNQFVQSINVSFNDKAIFDAMRGSRPAGTSNGGPAGGNGK